MAQGVPVVLILLILSGVSCGEAELRGDMSSFPACEVSVLDN